MAVLVIPVACIAFATVLVVAGYRVVKSKNLAVKTAKTETTRARVKAQAAENQRERATGVAEKALDVATEIHDVHGKVDILLDRTLDHRAPEPQRRGKHAGPDGDATVVPIDKRYIA